MTEPNFTELPFSVADIVDVWVPFQFRRTTWEIRVRRRDDPAARPPGESFVVARGLPPADAAECRIRTKAIVNAARRLLERDLI